MKKAATVDTTTQLADIDRARHPAIWINSVMGNGMTFFVTIKKELPKT